MSMKPSQDVAPRRTLRIPLPVETFSGARPDPRFLGYLASLSATGAFVQSSNPRPVGTYLCLRLHLPEAPNQEIRCAGEIIWTQAYSGALGPSQGMGIKFIEISEESERFLRKFCTEPDRPR
jgi:Tfp pilus assembly protein PilZ